MLQKRIFVATSILRVREEVVMGSINDARAQRGARIAACGGVTRTGPESWRVCSQTKRGTNYAVRLIPGGASCTCPDYKEIEVQCKHIWAVMATLAEEVAASATATPRRTLAVLPRSSSPTR